MSHAPNLVPEFKLVSKKKLLTIQDHYYLFFTQISLYYIAQPITKLWDLVHKNNKKKTYQRD